MADPIDFYFEFSSPYGYLASTRIDIVAARHGRSVNWRPYLMGAAMKMTGMQPLLHIPLVREYTQREVMRAVRRLGVPFKLPEPFPFSAVAASRAYYWLHDQDADKAKAFAQVVYSRSFGEGRAVADAESVAEVAAYAAAVDPQAVLAALQDPGVKERLKAETDAAIARGAFGSPYFIVDDEPFFGNDHVDELEAWLQTGGW